MNTFTRTFSILVIILFVQVVTCAESNCTFTSSKGDYYDLSPLSKCDLSGYSIGDDEGFVINICNNIKSSCNSNSAVCQTGSPPFSTGDATKLSFSDISTVGKGVTLKYSGGDTGSGCPNGGNRATVISFICDTVVFPDPHIEFISENPQCTYNFAIKSKYACPVNKGPQINTCKSSPFLKPAHKSHHNNNTAATLNVFLVPHTHDDVGWQVTPDQYYQGQVHDIISTVVQALAANPARKFNYVEQAFFTRWWNDPSVTDAQRTSLRNSYNRGQLEFVIGGWTMQDCAATTYGADIEQMTLGHQFLYTTFGAVPSKGWQLDPFGSGVVTGTLEKFAGFDAHLIDRISEKSYYGSTQSLQFNWQGVPSLGKEGEIFTEIMDGDLNAYCDFYFSLNFDNNPVNSGNVASYAQKLYQMVRDRAPHFKTNNILAAWGCDFAFQNANNDFASMDVLMNYLKNNEASSGIHVQYSTVSDYFAAVKASSANIQYPTNVGVDFFTYNDGGVWSGYFTSRTTLKGYVRQGEAAAQASEQIFALGRKVANAAQSGYSQLYTLRDANGQATHHDGVTGTSTPDVVSNYQKDLQKGIAAGFGLSGTILGKIISASSPPALDYTLQAVLNIKQGQKIAVVLYNSLGWDRQEIVQLPTNYANIAVTDASGNAVVSQVSQALLSNARGKYNLFVEAKVPALGYVTYYVSGTSSAESPETPTFVLDGADTTLSNQFISVSVSGTTGRVQSITNKASSVSINVDQELFQYQSLDPSGAYVFYPAGPARSVSRGSAPKVVVSQGKLVSEAFQVYPTSGSSYASQATRVYQSNNAKNNFVEMTAQVGSLPSHVEVISKFSTNINNGAIFFSDDNGFEFVQRTNAYPVYPIEFNHYPTIYASFIKDDTKNVQFTLVSDRSRSVSSLANGEIELMLHRNPDSQDNKGLGGNWGDTDVAYPTVRAVVDTVQGSKLQAKQQPYILNFPLVAFASTASSNWAQPNGQFVNAALPPNVHMQSLTALNNNSTKTILRFTHIFAVGEHPDYSKPVTVDISKLFSKVTVNKIDEVTLTANKVLTANAPAQVTLTPKQIRSFVIDFA